MSDPVTRLNAALEGRYRIESELGEGDEAGTGPPAMQIEVVVNWFEELRQRMGGN